MDAGFSIAQQLWRVTQASEAKHDATEGFDVTFPEDFADVELWALSPSITSPNWHTCGGVRAEPYWWWAMWSPAP